ncbi:MAG: hypothetical protein D4S01_00450 [Dehalococcoidia bacterium]|nr:MAG: hypothetical protein D4S01_00450 [Dehalococcoidia bacterium]
MANLAIATNFSSDTKYVSVVAPASTVNGHFAALTTISAGVYTAATPAAITSAGLVMAFAVCLPYAAETTENEYTIATGEGTRYFVPELGMKYSIPVANVTATTAVAVGAYVIPTATAYIANCVASLGGTESVAWIIEALFTKAGVPMFTMRCIKAQV